MTTKMMTKMTTKMTTKTHRELFPFPFLFDAPEFRETDFGISLRLHLAGPRQYAVQRAQPVLCGAGKNSRRGRRTVLTRRERN
jgi:hypothetical protein